MTAYLDESDFIIAFRKGKEKAFQWLYDCYYSSLCVYGFRLMKDEQAASDYAQEAFIRLWENRENFASGLAIRSYLYTLVKNAALNYLKHLKVRQDYCNDLTDEELESSAVELLIRQESERQLGQMVRVLSSECRRVVDLLAEGKSYKEVAELLHISPHTVKNHRVKALKKMKEVFRNIPILFFLFFLIMFLCSPFADLSCLKDINNPKIKKSGFIRIS